MTVRRDKDEERDSSDARRAGKGGRARRMMVQGPKFEVPELRTPSQAFPASLARLARLS